MKEMAQQSNRIQTEKWGEMCKGLDINTSPFKSDSTNKSNETSAKN